MTLRDDGAKAGVLERFHRRDSDIRVEVVRKSVRPEDHFAAGRVVSPAARVPVAERQRRELRQVPVRMDIRSALGDGSEEVRQPRRFRCEPRGLVDPPERVRMTRSRPSLVVMREELRLQRRHVDTDRTVLRAALAGEAEVERLEHLLGPPELELLPVDHLPEQSRAPARGVLLLARDHVAGTHHAAVRVATVADADAAERRVLEAAVILLEREVGLQPRRRVVRSEPKVVRDPIGVDDLARVHLPVGIPDGLELAERVDQLGPEHLREQLRARLAVAVLA